MRRLLKIARYTSVSLLLLSALVLLSVRLVLPAWLDYRAIAQQALSVYWQGSVSLRHFELVWWGWEPELQLGDLLMRNAKGQSVRIGQAQVRIDLSQSLWRGHWVFSKLEVQAHSLTLSPLSKPQLPYIDGLEAFLKAGLFKELLQRSQSIEQANIRLQHLYLHSATTGLQELGHEFYLQLSPEANKDATDSGVSERRILRAGLQLAPAFGGALSLQAEFDRKQAGQLYLQAQSLRLDKTPLGADFSGQAEVQIWGEWADAQFSSLAVQGDLAAAPIRVQLQGQAERDLWRWQAELSVAAQLYLQAQLTRQAGRWQGQLQDFQLADGQVLLQQLGLQAAWWNRLQAQGKVSELAFVWQEGTPHWQLSAAIENLSYRPWGRIPGLQNVSAQLQVGPQQGQLDFNEDQLVINWPLLPEAISLDKLAGTLAWQLSPQGLIFSSPSLQISNADLDLQLQGQIHVPADNPHNPEFDLQAEYRVSNTARVAAYLPVAVMKPKLTAWLERALGQGTIPQGQFVLRGQAADFPFDQQDGEFEVRFQVADMQLDYFPGWEPIKGLNAEVVFRQQGFDVLAKAGTLSRAALQQVTARIPDLRQSELSINAQLNGPTADMLTVLVNSPLHDKLGSRLAILQAGGDNDLSLNLLIPLKNKKAPVQVDGQIDFNGGQLRLPEPAPHLEQLRGRLSFSQDSVSADDLRLDFLGVPAQLSVLSQQQAYAFKIRGRFDPLALIKPYSPALEPSLQAHLQGQSDWTLELSLPRQESEQDQFTLALQSDLNGTAILAPPPLAKAASTDQLLRLQIASEDKNHLRLELANDSGLSSVFRLHKSQADWLVERGEVLLGRDLIGREAQLPSAQELVLQARLPQLHWQPGASVSESANFMIFDRFDLKINRLLLSDWQFNEVSLRGQKSSDGYQFSLDGNDVAGDIFLPAHISNVEPVYLSLSTLKLKQPLESDQAEAQKRHSRTARLDPKSWPPVQVEIKALELADQRLGALRLQLSPLTDGVELKQLELSSAAQQLSASGEWRQNAQGEYTRLEAKLYSEALGNTLDLLSIPFAVERAKTALALQLRWPGAPSAFDSSQLDGTLQLHIEEGLLSGIKPGLGRLVGLVNVSSLVRRLSLGFSDMVEQGLAFDQIDGKIDFAEGRASSDDMLLQGPAVNIAIQGWLGLSDQTVQQTITVMPQISSSLALAGAVAGGPALGAAVLLVGEVLKPGLEQAVNLRYRVSGTLAEPMIEPIKFAPETSKSLRGGGRK